MEKSSNNKSRAGYQTPSGPWWVEVGAWREGENSAPTKLNSACPSQKSLMVFPNFLIFHLSESEEY